MRVFICAGEPSGDLHGANLIRALRQSCPGVECVGFGGERMEAAGCRLLYPLCGLAIMGVWRVLAHGRVFVKLLGEAGSFFRNERPDAVVLIDYPGFNWWVARSARRAGIPVFYFVPPQLWAWASWRVGRMRRLVDHVVCNLRFEESWYRARGVPAHYVGHPYFDELVAQCLDSDFLANQRARPGIVIGLLPGSRTQEVERNLGMLAGSAARIHDARPDTRFLVACLKPMHRTYVAARLRQTGLPVEVWAGQTPEIIHLAHSCIAVSGSVGLELLHHGKPAVVVYGVSRPILYGCRLMMNVPYISLVNLLAEKELFPEFLTYRDESEAIGDHVLRWLNEPATYAALCQELGALRRQVAEPGACARSAEFLVKAISRQPSPVSRAG
jgi:lipid-A-disaccharide synthase